MATDLCTEEELTKVLALSPRQLRKLRSSGAIPFMRLNRCKRLYSLKSVANALAKLEVKTK
jgi:hypothetical protein